MKNNNNNASIYYILRLGHTPHERIVLRIGFLVGFGFFKVDLDPDLFDSYEYPVLEMISSLMNQSMGKSSHGGEVYAKCYDERGQPNKRNSKQGNKGEIKI